jgi:hypothetical protein
MILSAHSSGAGLFSHINFVVTHIDALGHADFHVDWTEEIPYADCEGNNLFDLLFIQPPRGTGDHQILRTWPHYRYTGSDAASLYTGSLRWRWRLHDCWNLLHVRDEILREVEEYCGSWTKDATALHVRNRRIGTECPGGRAPTLEDYGRVLYGGLEAVYLATDNDEAVEYFRSLLGDRLRTRVIARSADMDTEHHLSGSQSFQDARECLIDALIMARCARLVHSVSNIATAVLYMNPWLSHVFVTSGDARYFPPEPADEALRHIRKIIADRKPCRVVHLDHPNWKDWGLVYDETMIVRNATGCAGALIERPDDEFEIRWLDWEPEVFGLKPPDDPRFASARMPLYFELRKSRRVEVALRGGLGNQMFQYAFGLHVAKRLGVELILSHDGGNRCFALGMFGLENRTPFSNPDSTLEWDDNHEDGIEEEMIGEILHDKPVELRIQGWFQNENYFFPVADEIRRRFDFRMPLPPFLGNRTPVAVHVRLGDYLHSAGHCPLSPSYYETALAKFRLQLENPLFLVFSDDPDACPECLRHQSDAVVLPTLYDFQAFGMMISCAAFVIANSTFSWWAAWLNGSAQVICPEPFLPDKDWKICPERWYRIPVTFSAKA